MLDVYTTNADGFESAFLEVDANHHELWVHDLGHEDAGEELHKKVREFADEATDEFGAALLFNTHVNEYHDESNADGFVFHVENVRFNTPDAEA